MDKTKLIIQGKNLYLKGMDHEYSNLIISWRNDYNLGRFIQTEILTETTHHQFIENYLKKDNDYYFLAYIKKSDTPIGTVAIYNIDFIASQAEYGRLLIPSDYRYYCVEIAGLAISFAFDTLKLKKIVGKAQSKNLNAIKLLKSLRFQKEQTLEKYCKNNDDVLIYAMYNDEYKEFTKIYEKLVKPI